MDASPQPETEGPPLPKRSIARRMVRGGLIALVFLAVALAGLFRPPSREGWPLEVALLLGNLEQQRDTVNAVFIGSSYTGYHLDPGTLVQAAADHGLELYPQFLALPAMEAFEADAMVEQVLQMDLPQLQWIIIEYSEWDPNVIEEDFRGSRLVWWQSPARTGRLMRAAWADATDDEDRDDALPLIARAATKLAVNYSRIGNASEADRERNQTMTEARRAAYSERQTNRNFVPEYIDDLREHREDLARNGGWASPEGSRLRAFEADAFERQIRQIREAGAEPVYLLPPSLIDRGVRPDAPLLDFDDPDAYPEFFKPENRLDAGHMAESQIEPFSRLLGKTLAETFAGGEPQSDPAG